jgi:dipeptidyl aminopeptidase/acylaminoacyl peptidase
MYGMWHSPITPAEAARPFGISEVTWCGETRVWLERRGRASVLLAADGDDAPRILYDGDLAIRGGIGYGGGGLTGAPGVVCFVGNGTRLYRLDLDGGLPRPITPAFDGIASPALSADGRFVAFVMTQDGEDSIAVVDLAGAHLPRRVAGGADFYMQPAFSPDGDSLAYIAWDKPDMPFDRARLHRVTLTLRDGLPAPVADQRLTSGESAAFQPEFAPDGRIAWVDDTEGWWDIWLHDPRDGTTRQLTREHAEYAAPAWVQATRTIAWSHDGSALWALRNQGGAHQVMRVDATTGDLEVVRGTDEYVYLRQIARAPGSDSLALIASASDLPDRLLTIDGGDVRVRARSRSEMLRGAWSRAQAITWKGHDGETVHGWLHQPKNAAYHADGAPPLIVSVHGGPTAGARQMLDMKAQFFTSRGFAWLEVDHRGSTGYGRAYKDALRGMWGVYDVEDAVSGARALVARGLADGDRLILTGGSAGGYTTLMALVTHPGVFAAGVCLYGVGNQFTLAFNDAWKFEAHYNDTLLGALPDAAEVYRARSPIFHADRIRDPLLILHGREDRVVPIAQAEEIVSALRRRGVPHDYHAYDGEGHGWSRETTVIHALETMLTFIRTHVLLR